MANSTLKFYKVAFPSDTNALVDDLEMYLDGLNAVVIEDYQYLRPELEMTIKVNFEQSQIDNFDYNYMSMQNDNEDLHYFYIADKSQIAQHTMKLVLALDTINTLGNRNSYCNPRNFNNTTEILRQHEDRFYKPRNYNPNAETWMWRKIDAETEGVVPDKIKTADTTIRDNKADFDWYLIYKSDEDSPVETLLCASEEIIVGTQSSTTPITYTASDFDTGYYYYFTDLDNPGGQYKIGDSTYTLSTPTSTVPGRDMLVIWKDTNTTLKYHRIVATDSSVIYADTAATLPYWHATKFPTQAYGPSGSDYDYNKALSKAGPWYELPENSITIIQGNFFRTSINDYSNQGSYGVKELVTAKRGIYVGTETVKIVSSIDQLDRTDSKLVKIIKCPYCPIRYTKSRNNYDFGEDWVYDLGFMRYNKKDLPQFINDDNLSYSLSNQYRVHFGANSIGYTNNKSANLESKMFQSDLYTVKMVYDSFYRDIKLENVGINYTNDDINANIPIIFKPTSTISSKFGFKFDINNTNLGYVKPEDDFANILLTSRNNEETILNNEYLNYTKYGKEADLKLNSLAIDAAKRQAGVSTVATAATTVAAILDILFGSKVLGASLIAGSVVGGVTSANAWTNASDIADKVKTAQQAKEAQLAAQSTSTSGTDDIDLMSWYSSNRVHMMVYEPRDFIKSKLIRLFDLTGYAHSSYATPNVDSRIWYNYIKCNPEINYEGTKNLNSAWINDLKQKYNAGITVFHHHNLGGQHDTWSFDRQYENYETWMLGE